MISASVNGYVDTNMKTQYRIMFNGAEYVIQQQTFKRTIFGHWKRRWVEYGEEFMGVSYKYYNELPVCISRVTVLKYDDKRNRAADKVQRKQTLARKQNVWKKVWP